MVFWCAVDFLYLSFPFQCMLCLVPYRFVFLNLYSYMCVHFWSIISSKQSSFVLDHERLYSNVWFIICIVNSQDCFDGFWFDVQFKNSFSSFSIFFFCFLILKTISEYYQLTDSNKNERKNHIQNSIVHNEIASKAGFIKIVPEVETVWNDILAFPFCIAFIFM